MRWNNKLPKGEKNKSRYYLRKLDSIGFGEFSSNGESWSTSQAARFLRKYIKKLEQRQEAE